MIEFHYLWLAVLLPVPWILERILPPLTPGKAGVRVPFGSRLRQAADQGMIQQLRKPLWIKWSIWLLLVLALMKPQRLLPPREKELPTRDLLLLVDLSGSMNQEDFQDEEGQTVNRLEAVKQVAGDFLERREGDRVGVVVFGDAPYVQVPFTTDVSLCRQLLEETQVGMAGPRTAFGDAIGLGLLQFQRSDAPSRTLIALTDGNDSASQVPPVEASRVARDQEVRIHCIAIGDPETVGEDPLDEQTLRSVAEESGGSYFFAADRDSLENIYTEIDQIETRDINLQRYRPKQDLFVWPVTVALFLGLISLGVQVKQKQTRAVRERCSLRVNPRTGTVEIQS